MGLEVTLILQLECDDNLEDRADSVPAIPASIISMYTIPISHRLTG